MSSGGNKLDNNLDEHSLIMKSTIEANRKDSYDKIKNLTEYLKAMIASMMGQMKISKTSPEKKDQPKAQFWFGNA